MTPPRAAGGTAQPLRGQGPLPFGQDPLRMTVADDRVNTA